MEFLTHLVTPPFFIPAAHELVNIEILDTWDVWAVMPLKEIKEALARCRIEERFFLLKLLFIVFIVDDGLLSFDDQRDRQQK